MTDGGLYRSVGEGWELAYWPDSPLAPGVAPGDLGRLSPERDDALLTELQQAVNFGGGGSLSREATLVRQRPLPFYDGESERHLLVEVFRVGDAAVERARAVRVTDTGGETLKWIPLAWTSGPLHELNEKARAGRPLAAADEAMARDYVDFFAGTIEGDEGTFQVVRFGAARLVTDPDCFDVDADVLYGGVMFHCTFRIGRDGAVEMTDDRATPEASPPTGQRWLEGTRRIQLTLLRRAEINGEDFLASMCGPSDPEKDLEARLTGEGGAFKGLPDEFAAWKTDKQQVLFINGNIHAAPGTKFHNDWSIDGLLLNRTVKLAGSLSLRHCRFGQGLNLRSWKVDNFVDLEHGEFSGDINLDGLKVRNKTVVVRGSERQGRDRPPGRALNLRAVDVAGDVGLRASHVAGDVRLRYARIRGGLHFDGSVIDGGIDGHGIAVSRIHSQPDAAGRITCVRESVTLAAAKIPGHIELAPIRVDRDIEIMTPLALGRLRIDDWGTMRSGVGGRILVGNATVPGAVDIALEKCGTGIALMNVRCASLDVRGAVGPVLAASGLRTSGDAAIRNLVVAGAQPSGPCVDLQHARIGGALTLSGHDTSAPVPVPGNVTLGGATVQGRVTLRRLTLGGQLDLADTVVNRDIRLEDVEVGKSLVMSHLSCRGSVQLVGGKVHGDIDLQNAKVAGKLSFWSPDPGSSGTQPEQDKRIDGKLLLNAIEAGELVLTGQSWRGRGDGTTGAGPADRKERSLYTNVPVAFGLVFLLLPVSAFMVLAAVAGARAALPVMFGAVEYDNDWALLWTGLRWVFWTIISGILVYRMISLWRMIYALCQAPGSWGMLVAAPPGDGRGGLFEELRRLWWAAFARALVLVALAAATVLTHVWPELGMASTGGRVPDAPALPWLAFLFAVVWLALVNLRVCGAGGFWLNQLARPEEPKPIGLLATVSGVDTLAYATGICFLWIGAAWPTSRAAAYTVVAFAALGLLVWIRLRCKTQPSTLRMGFLDSGRRTEEEPGGPGTPDESARRRKISQYRLDSAQVTLSYRDWLQVATLNHLQPAPEGGHDDRSRCNLERARVRYLCIEDPIPDYVDISNMVVDKWKLPSDPADSRSYQYLNLLSHAAEFSTDSFTALERSLRNGGDRESAEEINRAMQRHTQWRESRFAQTASMLLLSLSGYGTKRARLIGVMTLWLLSTAFWFAADYDRSVGIGLAQKAEFMQVSDAECMPGRQLATRSGPGAGGEPVVRASPADCEKSARAALFGAILAPADAPLDRLGHGLALAMRYHVPILLWDIRPFIQPSGSGMWVYVTLVEAIHWILWPLLIASVVSAILPKRDG